MDREGCFRFHWRGLFSRWGASVLSGGCAPLGASVLMVSFSKKIVKCGVHPTRVPPPHTLWETLYMANLMLIMNDSKQWFNQFLSSQSLSDILFIEAMVKICFCLNISTRLALTCTTNTNQFAWFFAMEIFFKLGFTTCKAEQPLQSMELQEKEAQKD